MLLFIIWFVLIAIGVIFLSIYNRIFDANDSWCIIGMCALIIGAMGAIPCSGFLLAANFRPDYQFKQDMLVYETLKCEEEHEYITFFENVIEYNQRVTKYQEFHDNPWIGCFYYNGCEDLPYYEIKGE